MPQPADKPDHPHGTPPGQDPGFVPPGQGGTPPGQQKPRPNQDLPGAEEDDDAPEPEPKRRA